MSLTTSYVVVEQVNRRVTKDFQESESARVRVFKFHPKL